MIEKTKFTGDEMATKLPGKYTEADLQPDTVWRVYSQSACSPKFLRISGERDGEQVFYHGADVSGYLKSYVTGSKTIGIILKNYCCLGKLVDTKLTNTPGTLVPVKAFDSMEDAIADAQAYLLKCDEDEEEPTYVEFDKKYGNAVRQTMIQRGLAKILVLPVCGAPMDHVSLRASDTERTAIRARMDKPVAVKLPGAHKDFEFSRENLLKSNFKTIEEQVMAHLIAGGVILNPDGSETRVVNGQVENKPAAENDHMRHPQLHKPRARPAAPIVTRLTQTEMVANIRRLEEAYKARLHVRRSEAGDTQNEVMRKIIYGSFQGGGQHEDLTVTGVYKDRLPKQEGCDGYSVDLTVRLVGEMRLVMNEADAKYEKLSTEYKSFTFTPTVRIQQLVKNDAKWYDERVKFLKADITGPLPE